MRALMNVSKDRHGTYYARRKVPQRLQELVARILDKDKAKQVWLKKSLGTKVLAEANVRAKPVQMEFDRVFAEAEAQLKERPLRTSISDVEIKRIADYFYATEVAGDEELRVDGRGDDPVFARVHRQLIDAGVQFTTPYDLKSLRGVTLGGPELSKARKRAVASIKALADQHAANVLPVIREIRRARAASLHQIADALNARGIATARGGQWHASSVRNVLARA